LHSVVLKCQVAIMLALVHGTVATRTKDVLVHVLWVHTVSVVSEYRQEMFMSLEIRELQSKLSIILQALS